ncbi:MAG TPA: hypothetical protein VM936_03655, partial [Pyrinomonadaceae bacterium]|nr:hypothetical protein [Pyrinomonadaceae bacterium]
MKRLFKVLAVVISAAAVAAGLLALRIYTYGNVSSEGSADAAVVLGAAVWGDEVSPVFRERI